MTTWASACSTEEPLTQPLANLLMLSKTILCYVSRLLLQVLKFLSFLRCGYGNVMNPKPSY